MMRRLLFILISGVALGQTPTPTPATRALVDSLSATDLTQAMQLLKSNYVNPDALSDPELARATLEGLLVRIGSGAVLVANAPNESGSPAAPFYSDILANHIAYLRLGDLSKSSLDALDNALRGFAAKKIDAAIVDLRASSSANDFDIAAEVAKRFCGKGKPLFSLRKSAKQERAFTSDRDPAFNGVIVVLVDADTSGAAEALGAALRTNNRALVIGATSAGRAVEYSDQKLTSGKILRIASAEAVAPNGKSLFPGGLQPDIAVEMPASEKREIFTQSSEKGMGQFVFETERAHMNEAALIAGRNPEVDALEAAQRRGRGAEKAALRDPATQRAIDVITSIGVYQRR